MGNFQTKRLQAANDVSALEASPVAILAASEELPLMGPP